MTIWTAYLIALHALALVGLGFVIWVIHLAIALPSLDQSALDEFEATELGRRS